MLKTLIVLPDGTELYSGAGTANAIQSVTLTECVNEQQELTLGSCCSNILEAKIITPGGGLSIAAGDELTVYKVEDDGLRHKVGLFTTEKPVRTSANGYSLTAYDRVSWLDKDLTYWVAGLTGWPYALFQLADMVCAACGLELANTEIPNGDYMVQRFSADGITGRQLMKWIGQIAGRFCRATTEGLIEFAWYTPLTGISIGTNPASNCSVSYDGAGILEISSKDVAVADDGNGNVRVDSDLFTVTDDGNGIVRITIAGNLFYFQNGLSYEDFSTAPIEKVQLRQNEEDVGTVYPDTAEERNTYSITGNYLLTANTADALVPVAKTLYEGLQGVTYTPCKVAVPASLGIHAGDIVRITDRNGKTITAYVMTKTQSGQRDTLECTGSARRDSSTAVNNQSYQALTGKVLNLRTTVEGLKVENADAAGRVTRIEADLAGIRTQVSGLPGLEQQITSLTQSAADLQLRVTKIDAGKGEGATTVKTETGYTFNQDGLRIAKSNEQMENLLNNKGMYVTRGSEVILQADAAGVNAIDITVRNYLVVGDHARLEDYIDGTGGPQTACFWI